MEKARAKKHRKKSDVLFGGLKPISFSIREHTKALNEKRAKDSAALVSWPPSAAAAPAPPPPGHVSSPLSSAVAVAPAPPPWRGNLMSDIRQASSARKQSLESFHTTTGVALAPPPPPLLAPPKKAHQMKKQPPGFVVHDHRKKSSKSTAMRAPPPPVVSYQPPGLGFSLPLVLPPPPSMRIRDEGGQHAKQQVSHGPPAPPPPPSSSSSFPVAPPQKKAAALAMAPPAPVPPPSWSVPKEKLDVAPAASPPKGIVPSKMVPIAPHLPLLPMVCFPPQSLSSPKKNLGIAPAASPPKGTVPSAMAPVAPPVPQPPKGQQLSMAGFASPLPKLSPHQMAMADIRAYSRKKNPVALAYQIVDNVEMPVNVPVAPSLPTHLKSSPVQKPAHALTPHEKVILDFMSHQKLKKSHLDQAYTISAAGPSKMNPNFHSPAVAAPGIVFTIPSKQTIKNTLNNYLINELNVSGSHPNSSHKTKPFATSHYADLDMPPLKEKPQNKVSQLAKMFGGTGKMTQKSLVQKSAAEKTKKKLWSPWKNKKSSKGHDHAASVPPAAPPLPNSLKKNAPLAHPLPPPQNKQAMADAFDTLKQKYLEISKTKATGGLFSSLKPKAKGDNFWAKGAFCMCMCVLELLLFLLRRNFPGHPCD